MVYTYPMKRIAVLSGSFNPPTLAHLLLMQHSLDMLDADKGIFLPASSEYVERKMSLKGEKPMFNDKDRMAMLNLYKKEDPRIEVCDNEIKGIASSYYSYKSLCKLKEAYPDYELFFIIGEDNFKELDHWHNLEEFLTSLSFFVFERGDIDTHKVLQNSPLLSKYRDKFVFMPLLEDIAFISSTKVRTMIKNGDGSYRDYLSPSVISYIESL
ncbi:MAG: nicotinate (nicotinamide) nucleotide adenylyltransferase [Bacilli bacterium]|nr:nicotinate (nicotinamide) nucleotide adenylyltransferase [Bacilli bacterium]